MPRLRASFSAQRACSCAESNTPSLCVSRSSTLRDQATVDLLSDAVQVMLLAQGRDNRQNARYLRPQAAELTMIIRWCMGVTDSRVITQG